MSATQNWTVVLLLPTRGGFHLARGAAIHFGHQLLFLAVKKSVGAADFMHQIWTQSIKIISQNNFFVSASSNFPRRPCCCCCCTWLSILFIFGRFGSLLIVIYKNRQTILGYASACERIINRARAAAKIGPQPELKATFDSDCDADCYVDCDCRPSPIKATRSFLAA